jgi:hypothetical protein
MRWLGCAAAAAAATLGLASAGQASVITDSLTRDRLVGAWADRGDCSNGGLTFKDDGTFTVTGDYADMDFTGTFDVRDGRLVGTAGNRVMPVLPVFFTRDGELVLGPDLFERCTVPPPPPPAPTPLRP